MMSSIDVNPREYMAKFQADFVKFSKKYAKPADKGVSDNGTMWSAVPSPDTSLTSPEQANKCSLPLKAKDSANATVNNATDAKTASPCPSPLERSPSLPGACANPDHLSGCHPSKGDEAHCGPSDSTSLVRKSSAPSNTNAAHVSPSKTQIISNKTRRSFTLEDVRRIQARKEADKEGLTSYNHVTPPPDEQPDAVVQTSKLNCKVLPSIRPEIYEVPKLGSDRMPRVSIHAFPTYETLLQQINRSLPEDQRNIPVPVYRFSKKRQISMHPAKTGASPQLPVRAAEVPLPNDLDPEAAGVQLQSCDIPKEGYAASEFDPGLDSGDFVIMHESVEAASRWMWFAKRLVSEQGSVDGDSRVLYQQISSYDRDIDEFTHLNEDRGYLPWESRNKISWIESWVCSVTANTLMRYYSLDVTNDGFTSGRVPTSGLEYDWQEFPADLSYRPTKIYYGEINWAQIPQPKLSEPFYLENAHFNQTAATEIAKRALENEKKIKARLERKKVKGAQVKRMKAEQKIPSFSPTGSSKAGPANSHLNTGMDVYIRPAAKDDLSGILRIFNYYVVNTIDCPDTKQLSFKAMLERFQTANRDRYPFLVAVLRSSNPEDKTNANANAGHERIIGFTRCKNLAGFNNSCFADIAEMEVYVSPDFVAKKVGANLIDRALACIDQAYTTRRGVEFVKSKESTGRWRHGWRHPHTVCIQLFYPNTADVIMMGKKLFLEDHFGFYEQGGLIDACSKNGGRFVYSMMTMQRDTNRKNRYII